jgi:hypothetical protein
LRRPPRLKNLEKVAEALIVMKSFRQLFSETIDEVKVTISYDKVTVKSHSKDGSMEISARAITEVEGVEYGYFNGVLIYELIKPLQNSASIEVRLYKPANATQPYQSLLESQLTPRMGR